MNTNRYPVRHLLAAALLGAAGAANATISYSASASNPAFTGATIDNFADLFLNGVSAPLASTTVTRASGSLGYELATTLDSSDVNAPSGLYVVPVAGAVAISTGFYTDSLTFNFLSSNTKAFGGNFFATNDLGEFAGGASGAIKITVTDVNGLSLTQTVTPASATTFSGFTSDVALSSASVGLANLFVPPANTVPNTNFWASADNVVLSAVPEPSSWALMLAGGVVALSLGARRRG